MSFPTRWDPFFTPTMTLAEIYHYPTQHFVHGDFDPNERGDNWTG